jgi:16S rRNA (uracil1498-N3)-methyltransferase
MRQLILSSPPDMVGKIYIQGHDFRYLTRVLRLCEGDSFRALWQDKEEYLLQITTVGKNKLEASIINHMIINTPAKNSSGSTNTITFPVIMLAQALPKGQKMDLIIRQATEAGIKTIVPFVSCNSIPKLVSTQEIQNRLHRWERIIKEARQQSGSTIATEIATITDTAGIISLWHDIQHSSDKSRAILFHQDPLEQGSLHQYLNGEISTILLVIGPEGGFSREEVTQFCSEGFKPIVSGCNILRTETAALYAIAATRVVLLERSWWKLSNELNA